MIRAVHQLVEHYKKSPDQITEEELRDYFFVQSECAETGAHRQHHFTVRHKIFL